MLGAPLEDAVGFSEPAMFCREQRTERTQMALLSLPSLPEDVAAEVLRVPRPES